MDQSLILNHNTQAWDYKCIQNLRFLWHTTQYSLSYVVDTLLITCVFLLELGSINLDNLLHLMTFLLQTN